MKLLLLLPATILLLTACQTTPTIQPPGNELAAIMAHENWQGVATQYPLFAAYAAKQVSKLEYEQECTKARLIGALKAKKAKVPQAPPSLPVPPKPTAAP